MIETNTGTEEASLVAKGREFLQRGDVPAAVECYGQAFDPDSLDETEARSMLIEARTHLSRKHLTEALESFEEALLMGTDVQRRQALEGISTIGEMKSRLVSLTPKLKEGLGTTLGGELLSSIGLALVSDEENVVLVSEESIDKLAGRIAVGKKMTRLPLHFADYRLPIAAERCIPYTDDDDVRFILQVAAELLSAKDQEQGDS